MNLQLIRNATILLDYGGYRILVDPYFAPKHSLPSYTGKSKNPMVDLPIPAEEIINGVDLLIVSHLHSDHFDSTAQAILPKNLPLVCQPENVETLSEKGFTELRPVEERILWRDLTITRIHGHHGLGPVEARMGKVSGFVLQADSEPTLYLCGDTVMCQEVREAIATHQPHVIVTHSSGAVWNVDGELWPIVMDAAQTVSLCKFAVQSMVVAVHMEALDHGTISREDIAAMGRSANVHDRLLVPTDGEMLTI